MSDKPRNTFKSDDAANSGGPDLSAVSVSFVDAALGFMSRLSGEGKTPTVAMTTLAVVSTVVLFTLGYDVESFVTGAAAVGGVYSSLGKTTEPKTEPVPIKNTFRTPTPNG